MYSCMMCSYWTSFQHELDEHEEEKHPSCNTCQRMFRNHNSRRQHYLASHSHNYCGICDRDFHSPAPLRRHRETHQPRDIRCPQCDLGFPSASAMAKHVKQGCFFANAGPIQATARAYNGRAFVCYLCSREFGSLVSLNQHLNSGAHLAKEFRCKKCGFTTTWLSRLIAHIESEKCGFMFRSQVQNLATPLAQLRLGN